MANKQPLGIDVLTAARQRIADVFDIFPRIYVSFSAGKDSTVMLHLVMEEARRLNRRVGVLLVDLEGQYRLTIEHAEEMYAEYAEHIDPYWVALPIALRNAVSVYEPKWLCWDPDRRADWIREPSPPCSALWRLLVTVKKRRSPCMTCQSMVTPASRTSGMWELRSSATPPPKAVELTWQMRTPFRSSASFSISSMISPGRTSLYF